MDRRWWQKSWKYPKYWQVEASAAVVALWASGFIAGHGRWGQGALYLVLAVFWIVLAARGYRRRE